MDQIEVNLSQLRFDPDNPRIIEDLEGDQDRMFRYLIDEIGVEDLLDSLSASGLFRADPIIVREGPGTTYFVIEGNRRLAALKLLSGERPRDEGDIPDLPQIKQEIRSTFSPLLVQVGWDAQSLEAYLGYKHVTASREWSPEAKAKFVFTHAKGDYSSENLKRFAKTLGTRYPALKRWLMAFLVLRQAESSGAFERAKAPASGYFGTFYTLLGGQQAQNYLTLNSDIISESPVPPAAQAQLKDFIKWTIGSRDTRAAVNSRQQKLFEEVLASPRALNYFKVKNDLDSAKLYLEFNSGEIARKLSAAAYEIEDCLSKLRDVRHDRDVRTAFEELSGAFDKARYNMADERRDGESSRNG